MKDINANSTPDLSTVSLDEFAHQVYIVIRNDFVGSVERDGAKMKITLSNNEVFVLTITR